MVVLDKSKEAANTAELGEERAASGKVKSLKLKVESLVLYTCYFSLSTRPMASTRPPRERPLLRRMSIGLIDQLK